MPETDVATELVLELLLDDKLLELALDEATTTDDDALLATELFADDGVLDEMVTELATEDGAALELAFDELELGWMLLATELFATELLLLELAAIELLAKTLLATELDLAELVVAVLLAMLLAPILLTARLLNEELLFTELAARLLESALLTAELNAADELVFALLAAEDAPITGPLLEELAAPALLLLAGELAIDEDAKLELTRLLAELAGCDDCAALELATADDDGVLAMLLAFALLLDDGVSAPLEGTEEPAPPPQPTSVNDEPIAQNQPIAPQKKIFLLAIIIRISCPIVYSCGGQFIRLMYVKPSKRSLLKGYCRHIFKLCDSIVNMVAHRSILAALLKVLSTNKNTP